MAADTGVAVEATGEEEEEERHTSIIERRVVNRNVMLGYHRPVSAFIGD